MHRDIEEVIAREHRLLDPSVRCDEMAVRSLLHPDFREFGTSGTVWDRRSIVQATTASATQRIGVDDMRPIRLGPDAILLTYKTRHVTASSLRTSVWVRVESSWLLLHHAGTARHR